MCIRDRVDAVGFKTVIVQKFLGDHELTDEVMAALEHGVRIAPAHNIPYIETINVFRRLLPTARMVGAFETDFHRTVPFERQVYSVPYEWYEMCIRDSLRGILRFFCSQRTGLCAF